MNPLDFVLIVLGLGLIPVFIFISMILYRVYRILERVDTTMTLIEGIVRAVHDFKRMPFLALEWLFSRFSK